MWRLILGCLLICMGFQGCNKEELVCETPVSSEERRDAERGRFFGQELVLFGKQQDTEQLHVNPYLWQAALETVSFMGLAATDVSRGLIETQWYAPPEVPTERFKILVTVLDGRVRIGGVRVTILVEKNRGKKWQSAEPSSSLIGELEEIILKRARIFKARAVT